MIVPVILSGGSGTRLWPASRARLPKQLLALTSDRTLLQETALRLRDRAGVQASTLVICNEAHRFLVAEQLDEIAMPGHIVLEPVGRNTAPAAALAALVALRSRPGEESPLLLVMPADHVIADTAAFLAAVEAGEQAARDGSLVMFGVVPSYPHTGYGYIESRATQGAAAPIQSFVEKPDLETAVRLLEADRFFWNSGIFLFRADTYLAELSEYEPDMVAACRDSIDKSRQQDGFVRPDSEAFRRCPSNSIDYAVMERTRHGAMVPMSAGWSDVGSWAALHDVSDKDSDNNALSGDVIAVGCKSSYLRSRHRLVAAVGLDDLVVIEDADVVLVVHRDRSQDVKAIVEELRSRDRYESRSHRKVVEPWGSGDLLEAGDGVAVRRLTVRPGAALETGHEAGDARRWVLVRGPARISSADGRVDTVPADAVGLTLDRPERIENTGQQPLDVIEIRCGDNTLQAAD